MTWPITCYWCGKHCSSHTPDEHNDQQGFCVLHMTDVVTLMKLLRGVLPLSFTEGATS